jgi:hypothetical protein
MKALCKKNYDSKVFKKSYWTENKIYEILYEKELNTGKMIGGHARKKVLEVKYYIETDDNNQWIKESTFYEYFYTPEETQNILRTELIDKVLNGKEMV